MGERGGPRPARELIRGRFTLAGRCADFQVSRKTGHKWLRRSRRYDPRWEACSFAVEGRRNVVGMIVAGTADAVVVRNATGTAPRMADLIADLRSTNGALKPGSSRLPRSGGREWITFREMRVLPVGVDSWFGAGRIQPGDKLRGQAPADGAEIFPQLRLVARADDHAGHARPAQHPIDRDLGDRLAGFPRRFIERIDDPMDQRVIRRRRHVHGRGVVEPADGWRRLAATEFSPEPAHAERTPDESADLLVEREGHQLPFVLAADQRIVGLVSHVAGETALVRNREGFHELPAGETRAADVAHLSAADEVIERPEGLLHRGERIEVVQLVQVDVVRAQAAQAALAGPD